MNEIKLSEEREIVVREAEKVKTDKIKINQVTDNGTQVEALISFPGSNIKFGNTKALILWEGDAYKAIGQWTDSDVEKRLIELL